MNNYKHKTLQKLGSNLFSFVVVFHEKYRTFSKASESDSCTNSSHINFMTTTKNSTFGKTMYS